MDDPDWSIESNLYPPFRVWQNICYHEWLEVRGDHIATETANKRLLRGRYQTPDFLRFDLPEYTFSRTKEIIVTSFEIKTARAGITEVTDQVCAHLRFAHYAWAVVQDWPDTRVCNLQNDAAAFGFGVIRMPPDPRASGYVVETEPVFQSLSLHLIDSLILTYLTTEQHQQILAWADR